jgi:hypothetical protein
MQGPDPDWDGRKKPDCSESYAPVMIDGITATVLSSAAVQVNADEKIAAPVEVVLGMFALSLIYTVSAARGAHEYVSCRNATAGWRVDEALRKRDGGERMARAGGRARPDGRVDSDERTALDGRADSAGHATAIEVAGSPEVVKRAPVIEPGDLDEPPRVVKRAEVDVRAEVAPPAYFCVSSPSRLALEVCVRDRRGCEHARDIMGLHVGGCATQATASCFEASGFTRCFATGRACETQRARAGGDATECSERR